MPEGGTPGWQAVGSALEALETPEAPAGAGRCHGGLAGLWGSWNEPDTEMPRQA